ncbi:MAG: 16S rRNA (adenine(1518)-N(6)/adenine(1519)-N(6))-dimethyltransferase RsmA [Gammaproteobacteria bacterium]|nr:16S rRNA (adenine(1518)-N(6)/adenine(1519)-N(6))-dimethyltransferase RsmA [Gammaproteobacteria bacterium]
MFTHKARKRFGQNFLNNEQIIHQIIQVMSVTKNQSVVEIGPGKGAITKYLIKQAKHLTAIELDRDLIPILIRQFSEYHNKLDIISHDALQFDFSTLYADDITTPTYRLVGNLPYNISTPLLIHLIQFRQCIKDMHFMLQNEVVDRLVAKPNTKNYGRLSILMQYFYQIDKKFIVPPNAFTPMPKVDSAIVSLTPYNNTDKAHGLAVKNIEMFKKISKLSFQQRRKTIRNNLKGIISQEQFDLIGIKGSERAENLSILQFIQLSNLCS